MDSATKRRRTDASRLASQVFAETAAAMQAKDTAQDRYKILGRKFSGLGPKLRRIDRSTQDNITKMISDGGKSVAGVVPRLQVKCGKRERVKQAAELADGLDKIGDGFQLGAQSLRLLPSRPSRSRARNARINERIRAVHEQTTDLALEYRVMAGAVREAAGLDIPNDRQSFTVPALDESGCGGCDVADPVFGTDFPDAPRQKGKARGRISLDEARLFLLAGQLDETSLLTANLIALQAELFSIAIIAAAVGCDDLCAPLGVVRVSFYFAAFRRTARGVFPTIGFRWVRCCPCSCGYIFTQQRRITTRTFNQVTVLDPQRNVTDALKVAAGRGKQLANDFNSALTLNQNFQTPNDIVPALEAPECNC